MGGAVEPLRRSHETNEAEIVDAENPWPGLASFREQDREFFHGRGAETDSLERLVLRERLTVVFGQSGLGKTSLLQAGLFPRLRGRQILPVYVRLDHAHPRGDLGGQVLDAVARAAGDAGVEAPGREGVGTLWEYFHRQDADFWNDRNRLVTPILAFDQFEETFTLGRADATRAQATAALLDELADLIEGRVPASVRARLDADAEGSRGFSFKRHPYKVLLSLREDFLPQLEGLRPQIPSIAHNRLRLNRMTGEAALRVVTQVPGLVSDEVARRIIRFVAAAEEIDADMPLGEMEVEPPLLSVVCRELNNKRIARGESRISADLLEGSRDEIVQDLYERSVADLPPVVRTFVEDKLLTVSGFRDSIAIENALQLRGIERAQIDKLIARRLLRIERRGEVLRLELTHDLLTGVIRRSRDARRRREDEARQREAREAAERREREALKRLRTSRRAAILFLLLMGIAVLGAYFGFRGRQDALAAETAALAEKATAERAKAEAQKHAARIEELIVLSNEQRGKIQTLNQIVYGPLAEVATLRARSEALEQRGEAITDPTGRPLYAITLWVDLPDLRRGEVEQVRYVFDHPTFYPKERASDESASGFATTYTGWGCLSDVRVILESKDGASTPITFDSCTALEREAGISEFPRKGPAIPRKKMPEKK